MQCFMRCYFGTATSAEPGMDTEAVCVFAATQTFSNTLREQKEQRFRGSWQACLFFSNPVFGIVFSAMEWCEMLS